LRFLRVPFRQDEHVLTEQRRPLNCSSNFAEGREYLAGLPAE
jgi:hypothetical protein